LVVGQGGYFNLMHEILGFEIKGQLVVCHGGYFQFDA